MTTNDDIMKFLLNMEEKHAKEREQDRKDWKEMREKERKEDRAEMVKVVDLKVTEAIRPFEEKTALVAQTQKEMKDQVENLTGLVMGLKEKVESRVGSDQEPTGPAWQDRQITGGQNTGSSYREKQPQRLS